MSGYAIDGAVGGGYVLTRGGFEITTTETIAQAGERAAMDVIEGYPEVTPDFLVDLAIERCERLEDVVHSEAFKEALAEAIMADWPETNPTRRP